jgi:NH3-dependent NAD+ synthetase
MGAAAVGNAVVLLSGGLDSATTLAIAIMRTDLRTLTSTLARPAKPALHVVWLLILSPLLTGGKVFAK